MNDGLYVANNDTTPIAPTTNTIFLYAVRTFPVLDFFEFSMRGMRSMN